MRSLWIEAVASWQAPPPQPGEPPPVLPAADLLPPNERRRAPQAVAIALAVARQAVAASGRDAATLAHVFTSAHGDLRTVDALCATLADDPSLLSPTRFHHSVHNAAAGYWALATGCRAPASATAGFDRSFALGLLEAASLAADEDRPVLLVGVDTSAVGPLASVNTSRGWLGVALVLAPHASAAARWRLDWAVSPGAGDPPPAGTTEARNALDDARPLLAGLAASPARAFALRLPVGEGSVLALRAEPLHGGGS